MTSHDAVLGAISPQSPFLRHFFATHSARHMSMSNERNPYRFMVGPVNIMNAGSNAVARFLGDTPIGMGVLNAGSVTLYADLVEKYKFVRQEDDSESHFHAPQRTSLRVGSHTVAMYGGLPISPYQDNVKLSVPDYVNLAHRLGNTAAGFQGDYIIGLLSAMRGTRDIYSTDFALDAQGDNWAKTATGPFMDLCNSTQEHAGLYAGNQVRPRTTNYYCGSSNSKFEAAKADWSYLGSSYSANNLLQGKHLQQIVTAIDDKRNADIEEFPFADARVNYRERGGNKKMMPAPEEGCVLMCSNQVARGLMQDTNWVEAQRAAAGAKGETTGIFTGRIGMFEGFHLYPMSKIPVHKNGSGVEFSPSFILGKSAMLLLHSTKKNVLPFGDTQDIRMRRFGETYLPCDVLEYNIRGSKGRRRAYSIDINIGGVVTNFEDSNGVRKDTGVICVHSVVPQ